MTFDCPKCKKKYKVNEEFIPVGGAHVQCPSCSNVFSIYRAPLDIHLEPVEEEAVSEPDKKRAFDTEPQPPHLEKTITEEAVVSTPGHTSPEGIETKTPTAEERSKLWEKLQKSYDAEKKGPDAPVVDEPEAIIEEPSDHSMDEHVTETAVIETPETGTVSLETPPPETPTTETLTPETPTTETLTTEVSMEEELAEESAEAIAVEEEPVTEEDKNIKEAKRLARSLVKDILLYHGDKVEIGLRQGNLAQLIGDEIRKSWKFYKDSFPLDKTNNVNYFKEALNEIIGKGQSIFK